MSKVHVIAMDTHSQTTDICVKTRAHGPGRWFHVPTRVPEIVAVLEQVRGEKEVVMEEGPLADWLMRSLRGHAQRVVACDPRRNALVAKDGDKCDPIDAGKVADLHLGGYTRLVHHPESLKRVVLKEAVGLYHRQVEERVARANQVMGLLKRWGIMARQKDFGSTEDRDKLLGLLPPEEEGKSAARHIRLLWRSYDQAVREEARLHGELVKLAQQEEVVVRWQAVPGIGWIRGITVLAYMDTPWRFASKQKLWKYMGIGLVRAQSGGGRGHVQVEKGCNRRLKNVILGAAQTVLLRQEGVLYARYQAWREAGLDHRNARRNVARDIATVLWALWKSGADYDERLIGGRPVERA
jgi:transposase